MELSTDGILMYLPVRSGAQIRYRLSMANTAACNMFHSTEPELLRRPGIDEIDPDAFWPSCCRIPPQADPAGSASWYQQEQRAFSAGFVLIYTNIDQQRRTSLLESDRHRFYRSISLQERARLSVLQPLFDFTGQVIDFRIEFANYGDGIDDSHRDFEPYHSDIIGRHITELQPSIRQTPLWEFYLYCLGSTEPQRTELWYSNHSQNTALEVQGRRLDDGRLLISYTDVSQRHHLSQELESEKAWMSTIFHNVPVGILILEAIRDENGMLCDLRLIRQNETGGRLSRIPQELYERRPRLSELLREDHPDLIHALLQIVRTGIPMTDEVYHKPLDKWLRGKAVKHGDGLMITLEDVTDIHRRTEQLREQAALLVGVMDALSQALYVVEAVRDEAGALQDFRVLATNKNAGTLIASAPRLKPGDLLFEVLPQMRDQAERLLAVIRTGIPDSNVEHVPAEDKWLRITNTAFKDGFVSTVEDITELKHAALRIAEQSQLVNAVLTHSPAATALYRAVRDASGEIVDFRPILANRQALRYVNMTEADFLNLSLRERMKDGGQKAYEALLNVVETGQPLNLEHKSVFTNNWLSTTATKFGDGFIATSQDINEHKRQHGIIEQQAVLFNGVMKSLRNGLVIYRIVRDSSGNFEDLEYIQVADSVLRDTGKTRGDLIGHRISQVFPGIEQTDYWPAYRRLIATGEDQYFETHYNQHGLDNHLLNWLTPIGSDLMVSAYYIINDLKHTQQELEHTVRELRRSNEDLEQFASIASHDLQEPLRKVQSFGNMLEARYSEALGNDGRDLIRRMQNAAGRMRNLVTGLLSFSRLSGEEKQPLSPVDLQGLMQELSADLLNTGEHPGARIDLKAQLPFVLGIESQLRHLFHNLLTNALKFRAAGRPPQVSVSSAAATEADMRQLAASARREEYVRIQVSDNGIGFEPEYAEKIFGLFERLHGMSEYQGTGIGLSIARRVAERHQGAIRAESEPGKGSTFVILLRRAL